MRLEKELKKETQTRALVEQELQLIKKQYDVYMKLKDSELQNQKSELDKQLLALRTQEQKTTDERVRQMTTEFQQQAARQQEELRSQLERQEKDAHAQVANLTQAVAQVQQEKKELASQLEESTQYITELEARLEDAAAATPADNGEALDVSATGLAEEEKRIYVEQIEMLQQQVKDLEQEKFAQVQQDLDARRLSSPRPDKSFSEDDQVRLAELEKEVEAKQQAAERTLAMAESIKREAEELMAKSQENPTGSNDSEDRTVRLVGLFKESVNEMFFRFQDFFEEEQAMDGKQVLGVIRKVLKQSTKEVIHRLQGPPAQVSEEDTGNVSDGPPAPPPKPEVPAEAKAASVEDAVSTILDEATLAAAVEAAPTPTAAPAPAVTSAASAEAGTGPALQTPQYPSSEEDDDSDESEDDFKD